MNSSRDMLQKIEAIFNEAIELPEGDRPKLIEERCAGDSLLMMEVSSLLDACSAEELLASARRQQSHACVYSGKEGKRVGAYEIDRLIGRGGMGAVYIAHRADGNFQQQVAIKLIDLPLATDLFRERFRFERQILAGLNHPLIARLLDGGVTSDGEPFLVMEYVDGVPIDRYCREHQLSVEQRLSLFESVCEAVQFAHQNLVVHRDLKPDNIFVTGEGSPRLLDFGTAKLLSPSASAPGIDFTRMGFQSFTPQYASPEQVLGEPITTASDTYSLGVLLYLLITGTPPYELKEFTTAEMVRVICERPPKKPVVTFDATKRIDADLEAIVLKALRKGPAERYLTAAQLAADIRAYLGGRTVSARRGTLRYRTGKFARRNRIVLLATTVVLLSIVAGIGGVFWQARIANEERRKAEARAADLRQLSNSLLSEIDEAVKELPGSTPVQQLLVQRVLEHLDRMSQDAAGDRQTQLDLIDAYTRLGNLQGNIYEQNIGDPKGGLVSLDKALTIAMKLRTAYPHDMDVIGTFGLVQQSRSDVLLGLNRNQEAFDAIRSSVRAYDEQMTSPVTSPAQMADAAVAYSDLGDQLGQAGFTIFDDYTGALIAYRKSLELSQRALARDPNFVRSKRSIATAHVKIGDILVQTDPIGAIEEYHTSLAYRDALPHADRTKISQRRIVAMTYWELGIALTEARDYDKALAAFAQSHSMMEQIAAGDPKDMRAQYDLAAIQLLEALALVDKADPELNASSTENRKEDSMHALAILRQAIATREKLLEVDPKNERWMKSLAFAKVVTGTLLCTMGNRNVGTQMSASGLTTLRESAASEGASIDTLEDAIGMMLKVLPENLRDANLTVKYAERLVSLDHRRDPGHLLLMAQAFHAAGQTAKARATAHEALALLPVPNPNDRETRLRKLLDIEARAAGS